MRLVLAWLLMMSVHANAADFDIAVENFFTNRIGASAVFKITNNTSADYRRVYVDCVFMDKAKRAIDIGKAVVSIRAGGTAYDKATIVRSAGVKFVSCDVVQKF